MNRQIRQLGIALVVLFVVLFAQLNNTQVLRASDLNENPLNNRTAVRDFSAPRGDIVTADGAVIATSVPVDDQYEQLRTYPEGSLFGHLTGFFSFTYGQEGLEKTYNDELTGKSYALSDIDDLLTERVRANDVTISVSKRMQETARNGLGNRKGAVVALNPQTGAVLALWSNPSYDPNPLASHDFGAVDAERQSLLEDNDNPLLPRAFRESYPPGSTFKPVTAAAAIDNDPEIANDTYPRLQFLNLPNSDRDLYNFGRGVCGGDLEDLMQVSCNTGFAQMGIDLGGEALTSEAEAFGFNKQPPLDLPATARSRFPSVNDLRNNAPSRAYSSIGQQNVSATPLQMALVSAAIANGGAVMAPQVMSEIRNNDGEVVRSMRPREWQRATDGETAERLKELMVVVAARGTATGARIPGIEVGAKTGTAQTGNNLLHAWMISFAPADDPQVAVAVILENQPGVDETTGGTLAAPIAKAMMETALNR